MAFLPQYGALNPVTAQTTTGSCLCLNIRACKMKVDGKGILHVPPDMAVVSLGVSTEDKQLETAQRQNAEITARVINVLKSMGIPSEDIQTQSYSAQPQYDYIEGRQILRGYQVIHMLSVNVQPVEKAGQVIDRSVAAGANVVSGISFTLRDPTRYYRQALDAAIADAVGKALVIGAKLQVNVQPKPIEVTERAGGYPIPYKPVPATAMQAATPIQGGQLEITAEVEAIFGYFQ